MRARAPRRSASPPRSSRTTGSPEGSPQLALRDAGRGDGGADGAPMTASPAAAARRPGPRRSRGPSSRRPRSAGARSGGCRVVLSPMLRREIDDEDPGALRQELPACRSRARVPTRSRVRARRPRQRPSTSLEDAGPKRHDLERLCIVAVDRGRCRPMLIQLPLPSAERARTASPFVSPTSGTGSDHASAREASASFMSPCSASAAATSSSARRWSAAPFTRAESSSSARARSSGVRTGSVGTCACGGAGDTRGGRTR